MRSKPWNWTEEQLDILRKNKGHKTNLQLARMIGCTKWQVIGAMKKYGIKRTKSEVYALWDKWEKIHRRLLEKQAKNPKRNYKFDEKIYDDEDSTLDLDDFFRKLHGD
jgi:hypothetical protein